MCVICVKPVGVPMPALAEIKAMAEANPHGFGFCTSTGKWFDMDGCLYSNLTWLYYVNNRRFVYSPTA